MKRNIFLLDKDANTVPCGKYKKKRFTLRTQKSFYSACLHFPNARNPAFITQKQQVREAFVNITCTFKCVLLSHLKTLS